jgi:hypothetical protein
VRLIGTLTEV